jgi:hypothetical protein
MFYQTLSNSWQVAAQLRLIISQSHCGPGRVDDEAEQEAAFLVIRMKQNCAFTGIFFVPPPKL